MEVSTYVLVKAEMLNNVTTQTTHPDMILLFLLKKGNKLAGVARKIMKDLYHTPTTCLYCTVSSKNTEYATEPRMEFYLEVLHACAPPKENVIGVHTGAKFLLAAKVITHILQYTTHPLDSFVCGFNVSS